MTRDDIISMAKQNGFQKCDCEPDCQMHFVVTGDFERFANLVAAAEREACAKLLDQMAAEDKLSNYYKVAALRIRERGAP
jgi:hypothetical protein